MAPAAAAARKSSLEYRMGTLLKRAFPAPTIAVSLHVVKTFKVWLRDPTVPVSGDLWLIMVTSDCLDCSPCRAYGSSGDIEHKPPRGNAMKARPGTLALAA